MGITVFATEDLTYCNLYKSKLWFSLIFQYYIFFVIYHRGHSNDILMGRQILSYSVLCVAIYQFLRTAGLREYLTFVLLSIIFFLKRWSFSHECFSFQAKKWVSHFQNPSRRSDSTTYASICGSRTCAGSCTPPATSSKPSPTSSSKSHWPFSLHQTLLKL